tara:strand:+ start:711 stop:1013 length:303 start_codon:yes stop_codon:yes gene_type:complete
MIREIKRIKPLVKELLKEFPLTRDNDNLLILKVWAEQDNTLRMNKSFSDFSVGMIAGKYMKFESVSRARRKVQEENPELRGKYYKERKELAEEIRLGINK